MSAVLDDDELAIVETLAEFLAKEAAIGQSLDAASTAQAFDRDLLERLAELGFFGVGVRETSGGLGLPPRVLGAFCVEAGRVLLGGPWLEQLLAASLLEAVGARSLLDEVVGGRRLLSLPLDGAAWLDPVRSERLGPLVRFTSGRPELGFAPGVDGWLLPAWDPAGDTTVLVLVTPDGRRCGARPPWSELWRSHDVDLDGADGAVVGELSPGALTEHLRRTAGLLACVSVGSTESLLASTVEFLKVRTQFGRPLGTFQALQHMLADVFIELEHARSIVGASIEAPTDDPDVLVAMAKVAADRLSVGAAEAALQAHGGIGFTWELPVHHHLKEALRRRTQPHPTAHYRTQLRERLTSQDRT